MNNNGNEYMQAIKQMCVNMANVQKLINDALAPLKTTINQFQQLDIIGNIVKVSQSIGKCISDGIKDIQLPHISKQERLQLKESHELWGQLGWTPINGMPQYLFDSKPDDQASADRTMLKYCTKNSMNEVFKDTIKRLKHKKDYQEAVFCLENRQYKACALVLFAIIDGIFIKQQKIFKDTGAVAIRNYRDNIKNHPSKNLLLLELLPANIFPCLFGFFMGTNCFTNKVKWPNRNYINHGMSNKKVRKKDCIKLFLLLNNILIMLKIFVVK